MQHFSFKPQKTCSTRIEFDLDENNVVHNVVYTGGCEGNLKALPKLVEGLPAEQLIDRLAGISCGFKGTSCADQLARAVKTAAAQNR